MKKMRVGYVLPTLRKRAGWRTFTISLLSSLAADVDPLLFVANADAGEDARAISPVRNPPTPGHTGCLALQPKRLCATGLLFYENPFLQASAC